MLKLNGVFQHSVYLFPTSLIGFDCTVPPDPKITKKQQETKTRMEGKAGDVRRLCKLSCGFFGSPATEGLCSLCYKKALKRTRLFPTTPSSDTKGEPSVAAGETGAPSLPEELAARICPEVPTESAKEEKNQTKTKRNRCYVCRRKIGLTAIECRCGGIFCGLHRYSETHGCSFDYKSMGAGEITSNNPLIVKDKIKKL